MGATATVKGGLFESAGLNTLTQIQGTGSARRRVSQLLATRGMRAIRELAVTLDGVVPGSTAAASVARVEASSELGGKRTIETEDLVNRVTTSADVTEINTDLLNSLTGRTTFGSNPVANGDENPLGTR